MKLKRHIVTVLAMLGLHGGVAQADNAMGWIDDHRTTQGSWISAGTIDLPSGSIFVGDPSWGNDYHMRGATAVAVQSLQIFVLQSPEGNRASAVWLAAANTRPVSKGASLEFGMDSAYFAFGDHDVGRAVANIGDLDLPKIPDSFEFFLPHISNGDFVIKQLQVPPNDAPVYAVNTNRDGGLAAVWTYDANNQFSGILIDIVGLLPENRYLDTLLPTTEKGG
ncbi:MAG: hypothetical protein ACPGRD_03155 [Planktomarina sp.]